MINLLGDDSVCLDDTEAADLEEENERLEYDNRRLREERGDLQRELRMAWELITRSGVIPDTPENQAKRNIKGLAWELLKYY